MSKFLKIIVNLVVIGSIFVAAALLIPPVAGVNTVMSDNSTSETNLPVGTVAYGKAVEADMLKKGDKVIYTTNNQAYVYEITDMDASAGVYKVRDIYSQSAEEENIQLLNDAVKVIVVVPYIAYAAIALQSKEGLIVVGLGVIFLIILFILAELWRKDDEEEDEEDEDTEEVHPKEKMSRKERKRLKKEEKRSRKQAKKGIAEEKVSEEGRLSLFADTTEKIPETASETEVNPEIEMPEDTEITVDLQAAYEENKEEDFDAAMQNAMDSIAESLAQVQREQTPVFGETDTIVLPLEIEESIPEEKEISLETLRGFSEDTVEDIVVDTVDDVAEDMVSEELEAMEEQLPEMLSDRIPEETEPETKESVEEEIPDTEMSYEEVIDEEASCEEHPAETDSEEEVEESGFDPGEEPVCDISGNKEEVPLAPSKEELLEAARKAGENPEIIEDKDNHITFLDYSNLL
ncbi:MAG: hypothetical protein ACI4EO_01290 [Blautia sp.]